MKHIQLFEDYRIMEEPPKWFYLVLRLQKSWEGLVEMEFKGLVGISDNPEIINGWFDVRDTLLVMDGKEVLNLNPHIHKVDYNNPNQLVSNNFKLLNRLLQNSETREDFYDVCQKVFSRCREIKSNNEKVRTTAYFLNENLYKFEDLVETYIKSGNKINNLWDFTNVLWNGFPSVVEYYNNSFSWGKKYKHNLEDFGDKNILYFVLQQGILKLASFWKKEGEWIVKKDKISGVRNFKIPHKSKLYFKIDVQDPVEIQRMIDANKYGSYRGMSDESLELVTDLIKDYKLENNYDIQFIEGHMKTFDIWKDEPIPNTITYSTLMKTYKGFPKPKKKSKLKKIKK